MLQHNRTNVRLTQRRVHRLSAHWRRQSGHNRSRPATTTATLVWSARAFAFNKIVNGNCLIIRAAHAHSITYTHLYIYIWTVRLQISDRARRRSIDNATLPDAHNKTVKITGNRCETMRSNECVCECVFVWVQLVCLPTNRRQAAHIR